MSHRSVFLLGLGLFAVGCNNSTSQPIDLEWTDGQVWHIAANYRQVSNKGVNTSVDLDGMGDPLGTLWGNEVIWTYQVVETGLVPAEGDQLFPFAQADSGTASLSVVRAWADASLNIDEEILEADPVVYLVFHEDRDRLAGIVTFSNRDGQRVEEAYGSTEAGKSWSILSQSGLSKAPAFLAPRGITYSTEDRVLENGSVVSTEVHDKGVVDAVYDDEVGGGLVLSRYEDGEPWPTLTVSDNMEAHLVSDEELATLRTRAPMLRETPPEDFDYKAALASSVDVEGTFRLDEETLAGGWSESVWEGYEPWAGNWWPLSKGELAFGYDGRPTYSERIQDDVRPIKEAMDKIQEELREMEEDDATRDEKIQEYRAKNDELVKILVDFYNKVLADLDGGKITLANGKMSHSEDGWEYEIDALSPFDKYALALYLRGDTNPNPFFLPAWEILNQYNPGGGSWWGHCNGWAAAAILTHEPRESMTVDAGGTEVTFTTADLKGLLTEAHYSVYSHFYGARYNGEEDDVADMYPKAFHHFIDHYIRTQGVPVVFDTTATEAVWNYPAWAAEVEVTETTPEERPELLNLNTADLEALKGVFKDDVAKKIIEHREYFGAFQSLQDLGRVNGVSKRDLNTLLPMVTVNAADSTRTFSVVAKVRFTTDGVDPDHIDSNPRNPEGFDKTYRYTLTTDESALVIASMWEDEDEHPDFAWVPYNNSMERANGGSENPFLRYGTLLDVIGDEFQK